MKILSIKPIKIVALFLLLQLSSWCVHANALAETDSEPKPNCLIVQAPLEITPPVTFTEIRFADGLWDLAILVGNDKHRVTFSLPIKDQTKELICHYQSLAITPGINDREQWGWHLAWADNHTIYYARMDGEAWVSSVPKKIQVRGAQDLHFEQQLNLLTLSWKALDGSAYKIVSDDEGRSWSDITLH